MRRRRLFSLDTRFAHRTVLADYLMAALLVLALFVVRVRFHSLEHQPLAYWTLAVALAAWNGGLGPGLFATGLSVLFGTAFLPVHSDALEVTFFVVTCTTIATLLTDRRFVVEDKREVEYLLELLLNNILSGVITCRDDDTISRANPAACRLFGYTEQELRGQSITMLMPEQYRQDHHTRAMEYRRTRTRSLNWGGAQFDACTKRGEAIRIHMTLIEHWHRGHLYITGIIWRARLVEEYAADLLNVGAVAEHVPADMEAPYTPVPNAGKELLGG